MSMHTWFECKIRYEKVAENGMNKKVTEPYLVDALSFTEAEARIIEEMSPFISGEFTVSDIKRATYSELFPSEEEAADRWFKCKLIFITLDEKSGAEKKTSTRVLVQAADLRDAVKKLDEGMKGTMADYEIASVAETPLMDVYPYTSDEVRADGPQESGLISEMATAKKHVLSQCQDSPDTKLRVRETQTIIKDRARYDIKNYLDAITSLADEGAPKGLRVWFLGCGALLIENNELLKKTREG